MEGVVLVMVVLVMVMVMVVMVVMVVVSLGSSVTVWTATLECSVRVCWSQIHARTCPVPGTATASGLNWGL